MTSAAAPDDGPSVESWSEKDQKIVVSTPGAGYLYDLILRAKLDARADDVYDVLRYPHSHEIFRGIKDTLSRTTLQDDGKGRRKLRVGHRAVTKFLWLSVTFDTELFIWEDDVARTIRFTNARSDGFMKRFDGTWRVQPFTQDTLDSIYRPELAAQQQQQQQHKWLSLAGALAALTHHGRSSQQGEAGSTLVTLEQALAPRARPPGPVSHLVRGLCARVLQNMMIDLRREVYRRQQLEAGPALHAGSLAVAASKAGRSSPSLPVASITSSGSLFGSAHGRHSSSWQDDDASGGSSSSRGGLLDLLSAAVPLEVTIRL